MFIVGIEIMSSDQRVREVFINPTIKSSEGTAESEEGCLSVPGVVAKVKRPKKVVVQAEDLDGTIFTVEAEGLACNVLCHEIDHLNGVLFIDHLSGVKKDIAKRKAKKTVKRIGHLMK